MTFDYLFPAFSPVMIGGIFIRKKGKFEQSRSQKKPAKPSMAEQKVQKPARQAKAASAGSGKKGLIILLSLVAVILLGICSYGFVLKNQDAIYPNVYVAGVNVGGLRQEAAVAAVSEAVEQSYASDTLNVILPDRTLSLTPEVTEIALNPEQAIAEAMAYGRSGNPISAVINYLRAGKTEYTVDLDSSLNLDTDDIRSLIDQTAHACASEKIDPIVKVNEDAGTITITAGSPAVSLDADRLFEEVITRFSTGDFSDLEFAYDTVPCESVDLQHYYDKYCKDMTDAYYDEEARELVAEVNGYGFDLPYYTQKLAMAEPGEIITIQMEDLVPEVTLEDLEKEYFSDVLASYDSAHTANAARTKNLELACKAIDGTILNPGEEFSFNNIVGERTKEKGYLGAIVYTDGGKSETQEGGGVCQVASTIYTCTLLADLEVTERSPHMYLVTYVEPGMDATIYWGSLDFKFKNSTEKPLRIDASVSGGYVHIKLVGTKQEHDYDHIKLRGVYVNSTAWKNVVKVGDKKIEVTIQKGAGVDANGNAIDLAVDASGNKYVLGSVEESEYTGYTIAAYRDFIASDGSVLRSELLHTDKFNHRDRCYAATAYVEPEPEEPDEPVVDPDDPNYDPTQDPESPDYNPGGWFGDEDEDDDPDDNEWPDGLPDFWS